MGRRKKRRIIRNSPRATFFKPQGVPLSDLRGLALPLEGLEAMRLADGEGIPQEEASALMGVSRPTFNRILADARKTVANALSQGMAIRIDGGDYELLDERSHCPGRRCEQGGHGRGQGAGRGCGNKGFGGGGSGRGGSRDMARRLDEDRGRGGVNQLLRKDVVPGQADNRESQENKVTEKPSNLSVKGTADTPEEK